MFEPVYRISNDLLSKIIAFERAKAVVEMVPISSDWEIKFKNDVLARRAFACLRIYGNDLEAHEIGRITIDDPGRDESAEEVAKRIGMVAKEKDVQMILNYLNANRYKDQLGYLAVRFKQAGFGEKDLTQINALLMEKMMSQRELGVFRGEESGERLVRGRLTLPMAVEVPYQLEDFFNWFVGADEHTINPVIKAGVCLYEISRVQPFDEGSVLSGVLFTGLFLTSAGYEMKGCWAFEEELFKNKETYLSALTEVEKKSGDLTEWLEFFVGCLAEAALKTKSRVMALTGESPSFRSESGKPIALSERQISVMEELTIRGETTIKGLRLILPSISEDTLLRDVKDLINKRLVKKRGHTRGVRYVLGKVKYFH